MPVIPVSEELLQEVVDNGNEMLAVIQTSATNLGNAEANAANSAVQAQGYRDQAAADAAAAGASANIAVSKTTNAPSYKDPVRLTATTNLALSGLSETIDGRTVIANDRILAPAQNDQTKNGIWIAGAGAWTRSTDTDTAAEIANMVTWALDGDTNYGREFRLATTDAIVLGTTKLTFTAREFGQSQTLSRKRGVAVIVGDSNRNGRIAYYTNLPLELTGSGRPLGEWTFYNMGQNGSQLSGWRIATEASSFATAPAPADYTGVTNPYTDLYQVCKAAPDVVLFSLGINDYNSPANRGGTSGTNFPANLDWAINFILANNPNRDGVVLLEIPQPYTGIDFVSGPFSTDWAGDAGGLSAADNAAKYSQILRGNYLRWKGRNPRVIVHDTAEIFNPGVTTTPTLHRCDDPATKCLDPDAAKMRFKGNIASNVLTLEALYSTGSPSLTAPLDTVTTDGYGSGTGRRILSLLSGTNGTVGATYSVDSGADVASTILKIPQRLIDDSLHFAGLGGRRIIESYEHQASLVGRRSTRSFLASAAGSDPFWTVFQNNYESITLYMGAKQKSGANMLLSIVPSPEAVPLLSDPQARNNDSRNSPYFAMSLAEYALLTQNLAAVRRMANMRGTRVKLTVLGGTGTIYTASAVSLSSMSTSQVFYFVLQFNDIDMTPEPTTGRLMVWVEDASGIPFINKSAVVQLPPGTAAVATTSLPNPWSSSTAFNIPLRRVAATRAAATDGAMTIDVGLSNQSADARLVEVATTKATSTIDNGSGGAGTILTVPNSTSLATGQTITGSGVTAGTVLGTQIDATHWNVNNSQLVASTTLTFGIATASAPYSIGTITFSSTAFQATMTPNQTNIDNAVNAGIGWLASASPSTAPNHGRFKGTYRLVLTPSITLTKPIDTTISD